MSCYLHGLNGSGSPQSRIGIVCKTTSVCTKSWTTFVAAWTVISDTITETTLDTASHVFIGVINDEPGCMNGETSFFQNLGSVDSIKMATSVFGDIVVNAHWHHAFVIVILPHHLA
ncbi:hypothetical protein TNCV_2047311 [Trichonephila clavipes]|uniref:Uncharacterized protein n=1 Tax=Trichonephila clavipes TaxID=2585209 RepID=A0A8X6SV24_TRICX|nr:hypothetical protein TNCV_2047311 [Trichonephila clavipes]